MQLVDITGDMWNYLDLERHLNEGSPSGFSLLNRPQVGLNASDRGGSRFQLPLFELAPEVIASVGSFPEVAPFFFPVHPDMESSFRDLTGVEASTTVPAAATSSGRTVYADVMGKPQFVKLSYHGRLGRLTRRMPPTHLMTAIEVSAAISASLEATQIPGFAIQEEYFGANVLIEDDGWGFVLRHQEPIPQPPSGYRVPGFSLFSRTFGSQPVVPLLHKILDAHPELASADRFFTDFIKPIVDGYFLILRRTGLQLEAHAQNLVYHFDREWRVVSVAYRDMESVDKDASLMHDLGIPFNFTQMDYKTLRREKPNYSVKHSFMYDFKLGEYHLRPLCNVWSEWSGKRAEEVHRLIQNAAREHLLHLPTDFFPDDWYDYEAEIFEGRADRPYIAHPSPSFR
ncbi:hypothetical protein [Arthrobacter sp. Bz4]|uniref:hypothetical protein n=1 Tax=Arthrobacter sp. Bz4 TaxID=2171979 RepID=UPI000D50E25E|nr:hypothetical protein [Arthrobacter sp. Bz4]PVE14825.1 hypothetical protein DDA93_15555 [Arthrobacter sp. Bz4]